MPPDDTASLRATIRARAAEFDPDNMARVIEGTLGQLEFALSDPTFPSFNFTGIEKVVVAGMGGSALPADIVADVFADQLDQPLLMARHYRIPWKLDRSTLVIVASFSGTTEETLSALEQALESGASIVAMSAGGTLADRAADAGCPFIRIPKEREPAGFQPRCASGYFATYLTRVLDAAGVLRDGARTVESVIPFLRESNVRPDAERAAQWLGDRVPIVFTDQLHEQSLARIAKIKLNENSKRPAFYSVFPEANHNEMIGLAGSFGRWGVFYLKDPSSHPMVSRRYEVMRDVFSKRGLTHVLFDEWELPGETHAQRVFAGLTFADWWSYSLALLDGVNPTPVELVEAFKRELRD